MFFWRRIYEDHNEQNYSHNENQVNKKKKKKKNYQSKKNM